MRTKKPEIEEVLRQFETWRANRHGRLIPEELWKAAVGLLDRYSASTICRHLRVLVKKVVSGRLTENRNRRPVGDFSKSSAAVSEGQGVVDCRRAGMTSLSNGG